MTNVTRHQRIDRLTQRQKDCLELVAQGYTAKQIGRMLGISHSTVDNHIQAAIQLLEASGRAEAARLYIDAKGDGGPRQRMPSEPRSLAVPPAGSDDQPEQRLGGQRGIFASLLPPIGGRENALTKSQTLVAVFRIALFGALVFIASVMIIVMSIRALG